MSNIDKMTANEQLFTELTPEQAAIVEGGLFIHIEKIHAIKAGADTLSKDDTYIKINGEKLWGEKSFGTGQERDVNRGLSVDSSFARVTLFDEDWGNDDYLGGFTARNTNGSLRRAQVSGSGSTYDVYYRAFG